MASYKATPPVSDKLHGNGGVYYEGDWLPIEECHNWVCPKDAPPKPREQSQTPTTVDTRVHDVVIIGGGCIGASVARELSKYALSIVLLERDNDISQGASKGNSGIVHAGYDDKPDSVKAKFCWPGNQMFAALDKDLRFGFRRNGSLVIGRTKADYKHLQLLYQRGLQNGVRNLSIIEQDALHQMEPLLSKDCSCALYSPDAGIVAPYEYTIALIENAAANGVDVRTKHEVTSISHDDASGIFTIRVKEYLVLDSSHIVIDAKLRRIFADNHSRIRYRSIRTRSVINCAGLFADKVANMIGDNSFTIKPRLGEYILLDKHASTMVTRTLFPCPTKRGKGVLVQSTLWGNILLGPTSRYFEERLSSDDIIRYLLSKSRKLVPSLDSRRIIHSFAGSRPKSDRGWIVAQTHVRSAATKRKLAFINLAGIDSPGLASSPAIAQYAVHTLLQKGCAIELVPKADWNGSRRPLVFPKLGWNGLKLKKFSSQKDDEKVSSSEQEMKQNVVCRCERVTEFEIMDCMNRVGVDVHTTQAVRRRTRAGMGKCQGKYCEQYVRKLIAERWHVKEKEVAGRSWPATSLLSHRWLDEKDRVHLDELASSTEAKL